MNHSPPGEPFDEFASQYHRLLGDPLRSRFAGDDDYFIHQKCRALLRELRAGLGAGPWRVLDVGCGQGTALSFLSSHCRIVGADVSMAMLQQCPPQTSVVAQEAFALPFVSRSFDAAFAFCVYHHIQAADHVRHLRELSRVVRPGGLVLVFEHNPLNPITRRVFMRAPIDRGCEMIPRRRLVEVFRQAGLEEIRHRYVLFVPQFLFSVLGFSEPHLARIPFGGQYYVAGRAPS